MAEALRGLHDPDVDRLDDRVRSDLLGDPSPLGMADRSLRGFVIARVDRDLYDHGSVRSMGLAVDLADGARGKPVVAKGATMSGR